MRDLRTAGDYFQNKQTHDQSVCCRQAKEFFFAIAYSPPPFNYLALAALARRRML
jgi:hypothetical protein